MGKGLVREVCESVLRTLCERLLPDLQDARSRAEAAERRAKSMEQAMTSAFASMPSPDSAPRQPASSGPPGASDAASKRLSAIYGPGTGPLPKEYEGPLLEDAEDLRTAVCAKFFHHLGMGGTVDAPFIRIFWELADGQQQEIGRWRATDQTRAVFYRAMAGDL